MRIAYYNTLPSPPIPGTESVDNEIRTLVEHFGGDYIDLYPFKKPHPRFPWQMVGLHRFRDIRKMDRTVDLHHVFSSGLYPYPVLSNIRKPIVYSVVSGLNRGKQQLKWPAFTIVVGSERDLALAERLGYNNCRFVRPGIDCSRIKKNPLMLKDELTLLSASAPWTCHQFHEKGFDLLFEAVSRMTNLRLIVLMRGLLTDVLRKRLKSFDIEDRVIVIDTFTDINTLFSRTHGTIVLSENPVAIRGYPHSLIESLAAGKPVILSDIIPMADYVRDNNLGCIVKDHSIEALEIAIEQFIRGYDDYRRNADVKGGTDFSRDHMIDDYLQIYLDLTSR